MVNTIERNNTPENDEVDINVTDNGLNIEEARNAQAIRVIEGNSPSPENNNETTPEQVEDTSEANEDSENAPEAVEAIDENNEVIPETPNENNENIEETIESNEVVDENNENESEEVDNQEETPDFSQIRQQWQERINQNNAPKNIFSRAYNYFRKSDGLKVAAGLGVATLAVTTTLATGGVGMVAAPVAYGLGVKMLLEGGVGFIQNNFLGGRRLENDVKNIENNIEQKLRIYESYESSDVETRDAMLQDMKNEITRLNEEHQVKSGEYEQWYAKQAMYRSAISTVGSIGAGITMGIPLGTQNFDGDTVSHAVRWSYRGFEFVYNNAAEQVGANVIGSSYGQAAHVVNAASKFAVPSAGLWSMLGTGAVMIGDTLRKIGRYRTINRSNQPTAYQMQQQLTEATTEESQEEEQEITARSSDEPSNSANNNTQAESNNENPSTAPQAQNTPRRREPLRPIRTIYPQNSSNVGEEVVEVETESTPIPTQVDNTVAEQNEDRFALKSNISRDLQDKLDERLKEWKETNEININEFVHDVETFRYKGRADARVDFEEIQKNKLIENADFENLVKNEKARIKYTSEVSSAFIFLHFEDISEWRIKFDTQLKKYRKDNIIIPENKEPTVEKSKVEDFSCDYDEITDFVSNLSKNIESKDKKRDQFNKILKRNEDILRNKIMIRRDYIDQNEVALYLAEIRNAYNHLGIELSVTQEKKYKDMLSSVGKKIG